MTRYTIRPTGMSSGGWELLDRGRVLGRIDEHSDAERLVATLEGATPAPAVATSREALARGLFLAQFGPESESTWDALESLAHRGYLFQADKLIETGAVVLAP